MKRPNDLQTAQAFQVLSESVVDVVESMLVLADEAGLETLRKATRDKRAALDRKRVLFVSRQVVLGYVPKIVPGGMPAFSEVEKFLAMVFNSFHSGIPFVGQRQPKDHIILF